jgi:hypothetical protein
VQPDGKILISALLDQANGNLASHVVRLNSDGTTDTSFHVSFVADGAVRAILAQADGRIVLSGDFKHYDGQAVSGLVRLDSSGRVDASFKPAIIYPVETIIQDTVGRYLVAVKSEDLVHLSRFDHDGAIDSSFNTSSYVRLDAICVTRRGDIIIGGLLYEGNKYSSLSDRVYRLLGDIRINNPRMNATEFSIDCQTLSDTDLILEAPDRIEPGFWTEAARVRGDGSVKSMTDSSAQSSQRYYRLRTLEVLPPVVTITDFSKVEVDSGDTRSSLR